MYWIKRGKTTETIEYIIREGGKSVGRQRMNEDMWK